MFEVLEGYGGKIIFFGVHVLGLLALANNLPKRLF